MVKDTMARELAIAWAKEYKAIVKAGLPWRAIMRTYPELMKLYKRKETP